MGGRAEYLQQGLPGPHNVKNFSVVLYRISLTIQIQGAEMKSETAAVQSVPTEPKFETKLKYNRAKIVLSPTPKTKWSLSMISILHLFLYPTRI